MKIVVLGADGYIGWPACLYLSIKGHDVIAIDSLRRRSIDIELGTNSLVPIESFESRVSTWNRISGSNIVAEVADIKDPVVCDHIMTGHRPDAIIHLAEQRSAPYSMIDQSHAIDTQLSNVTGTLNLLYSIGRHNASTHLVKMGTMGEYGTPNIDIEEGWLNLSYNGRSDRVPFPKQPGSFYHLSKVFDSQNIEFCCRTWGLQATDINQGIVYGQMTDETSLDPKLATRFDYDAVFGTVLNRFVVQASIGHSLTVYGRGGQVRTLINISDSIRCLEIACLNPPAVSEYRVFNQFAECLSVSDLANLVASSHSGQTNIVNITNPRVELENHYYNPQHTGLAKLGFEPTLLDAPLVRSLIANVDQHHDRIRADKMMPNTTWRL